jgi:hypothetical protein
MLKELLPQKTNGLGDGCVPISSDLISETHEMIFEQPDFALGERRHKIF